MMRGIPTSLGILRSYFSKSLLLDGVRNQEWLSFRIVFGRIFHTATRINKNPDEPGRKTHECCKIQCSCPAKLRCYVSGENGSDSTGAVGASVHQSGKRARMVWRKIDAGGPPTRRGKVAEASRTSQQENRSCIINGAASQPQQQRGKGHTDPHGALPASPRPEMFDCSVRQPT